MYIGVLNMLELPPFKPSSIIVDEVFIEVQSEAGSGETLTVPTAGENRIVTVSLALSVDCTPGFGGDDCERANTCNEGIICNRTLGYCNTEGECVCFQEYGGASCYTVHSSSEPTPDRTLEHSSGDHEGGVSGDDEGGVSGDREGVSGDSTGVTTTATVMFVILVFIILLLLLVVIVQCIGFLKRRRNSYSKL